MSDQSTTDVGPIRLPSDTKLVNNTTGTYAVFEIAPGVSLFYAVDGSVEFDEGSVEHISTDEWATRYPNIIDAGHASELATVTRSFGSFREMWDSVVGQVMGYNNPARHDPGVLRVLAELAARPDMTEAELQNRLQATEWYQTRTTGQLEWNSLSEEERRKRLDETAARMVGTWFQFGGVDIDVTDPRIQNYLEKVASGEMGYGAWTEIVKNQAEDNPESPWSRQKRGEEEEQKKRPIDIENTAQRVREATERWGVRWSDATISQWAKDMVEKNLSDEDLDKALREQANVLYGSWKDPEIETATAAAPWLETYRRVMESSGSVFTPQVQQALVAGQGVFEFESDLKKTDGWLGTKNGQDSLHSTISEMGKRMGFV